MNSSSIMLSKPTSVLFWEPVRSFVSKKTAGILYKQKFMSQRFIASDHLLLLTPRSPSRITSSEECPVINIEVTERVIILTTPEDANEEVCKTDDDKWTDVLKKLRKWQVVKFWSALTSAVSLDSDPLISRREESFLKNFTADFLYISKLPRWKNLNRTSKGYFLNQKLFLNCRFLVLNPNKTMLGDFSSFETVPTCFGILWFPRKFSKITQCEVIKPHWRANYLPKFWNSGQVN